MLKKGGFRGIPLVFFWMLALPFAAGLKLVKWAHNIYQQTYVLSSINKPSRD